LSGIPGSTATVRTFSANAILDNIVDDYLPLIDQMESEIDWIEDAVVAKPVPRLLRNSSPSNTAS